MVLQARLMGMRAAQSMAGAEDTMGFSLELFTHVTRFCGKKVVLLGLYNGQRLEQEPEEDIVIYSRESQVRVILFWQTLTWVVGLSLVLREVQIGFVTC